MSRISTEPRGGVEAAAEGPGIQASIPGYGSFTMTAEALAMVGVFGGTLHCYVDMGGCRKQGLYFSRTEAKKPLRCILGGSGGAERSAREDQACLELEEMVISVSHEIAPKLDGAVLDFGAYNKMQRFVWRSMPGVRGPACTCLRSIGPAAGKRPPCLDDQGVGLSDI